MVVFFAYSSAASEIFAFRGSLSTSLSTSQLENLIVRHAPSQSHCLHLAKSVSHLISSCLWPAGLAQQLVALVARR
jgi:hypothetical protein